jgi:RNAse (barnase) inhibitor barstar
MDDWYVPSDNKRWYKLSLNPFDIDFLKIVYVGTGFFKDVPRSRHLLTFTVKHFNLSKASNVSRLLYKTYFRGGYITNSINEYNKEFGTEYKASKIYSLKNRITKKVKTWLTRVYKEYNFFDNSLEYIKEYYQKWVMLVETIQKEFNSDAKINTVYEFIKEFNIRSTLEFLQIYDALVLPGKLDIEGLEQSISKKFYDKLLYSYTKFIKEGEI